MAVAVEIASRQSQWRRHAVERRLQRQQVVPDGAAQVRQVEAAEQAVPVGIVGLGAVQLRLHGRRTPVRRQRRQARRDVEHALVHPVRFREAHEEVAPHAAAQEGLAVLEAAGVLLLLDQRMVGARRPRRQRPFVHLDVGGGRQIDDAARLLARVEVGVGCRLDQRRSQHALDEARQPALLVDPVVGLGPDAELLDVVEIDGGAMAFARQVLQPGHGAFRRREGQPVARLFRDREQVEPAAILLGGEMAVEPPRRLAGAEEVIVVHRHVFDAGVGQRRHDGRFPDALGEPGALGPLAEQALDLVGKRVDLADAVAMRDRGEHRLAIAGAEPFDLTAPGHRRQPRHVLGIARHQPVEQPAGEMHGEAERRIALGRLQKHAVAADVRFLHDRVEIADRLVGMHAEEQGNGLGHGGSVRAEVPGRGAWCRLRHPGYRARWADGVARAAAA